MKPILTFAIALLASTAASVDAQGTKAPTGTKAPAGAKAADTSKKANTKAAAPDAKAAAPGTKTVDTKQGTKAPVTAAPGANTKQVESPTGAPAQAQLRTPTIMREVYAYDQEGRRDPFISLLTSSTLRPTVADLRLTGILYDENGPNSIAVMRDVTDNKQYKVVTGQTLGRMKVALIKRRVVIFSIEEFGMNRQDSLVLGDTTKARAK